MENKSDALKFDSNKHNIGLLDPKFILDIVKVLEFGASKYGTWNWENGLQYTRLYNASMRHLLAWYQGEDLDQESNHSHLLHAICNLYFLYYFSTHSRDDLDDRFFKNKQGE